jgi:hypothetical protein
MQIPQIVALKPALDESSVAMLQQARALKKASRSFSADHISPEGALPGQESTQVKHCPHLETVTGRADSNAASVRTDVSLSAEP